MTKRFLSPLLALVLAGAATVAGAATEVHLEAAQTNLGDRASLQRGAGLFMNYCSGCHSLGLQRYSRTAEDLGLTEEQMMGNLAFTDAKFVKSTNAPCPPELAGGGTGAVIGAPGTPGTNSPLVCDISGQWLPGISNWAFSFGGEYNIPANVLGEDGEFYLGADGNNRSKFSSNASRSRYTDIEGYTLANFRLGFRTDKFNLFGWVRNAFDEEYFDLLATTPGNTGLIVGNPGDPRTYGATISLSF